MTITKNNSDLDQLLGDNIIHSYTRAQAIEDGVLVDVTDTAKEAGFTWPVAMSRAAWADCVEWSDEDTKRQTYQDLTGRLWDVLSMASFAIRSSKEGNRQLLYPLFRVPRGGSGKNARRTMLKLITGPGDSGEPVVTIMLPNED
jgi:hypothetical protein